MKSLLLSFLLLMLTSVKAQDLEPFELVQKIFTDQAFAKKSSNYATGEYNGHPNANDINEAARLSFRLLEQSDSMAVVNMTVRDTTGYAFDTYVHLEKSTQWKINAFRGLAMTGLLERALEEMEQMTEEQIATLIEQDETLNSKEDFHREMENIRLTLASDDTIITHFEKNDIRFEALKEELLHTQFTEEASSFRKENLGTQIKTDYQKLLIQSIYKIPQCENCFEFLIGGMIDNTVGYWYIPNKEDVPKMNPSRIIMVREIGKGWYVFKTT